jgi:hypothetical protein
MHVQQNLPYQATSAFGLIRPFNPTILFNPMLEPLHLHSLMKNIYKLIASIY